MTINTKSCYSADRLLFLVSCLVQASGVTFIRLAPALNLLLVLCDGTLSVLSLSDLSVIPLSGSSKLKHVQACCVNENPTSDNPFSIQVILAYFYLLDRQGLDEQRSFINRCV